MWQLRHNFAQAAAIHSEGRGRWFNPCDNSLTLTLGRNRRLLFAELGNPMREPGDFAARGVAMNDALLPSADDGGLRVHHGENRSGAVAG